MTFPKVLIIVTTDKFFTGFVIAHLVWRACELRDSIKEVKRKEYHCSYDPFY